MKIIILSLFVLISSKSYSQDIIYKKDGSEIETKIVEITNDMIKYKRFDQQTGPLRNMPKSDVFMIIYEDGTKEVLKKDTNKIVQGDIIDLESRQNVTLNKTTNSSDNINTITFNFGIRAGYFMPSEKAIKEIYGNGLSLGSDLIIWIDNGFGGGISLEYFSKKGNPYTLGIVDESEAQISIIPISLLGYYKISNTSKTIPYFGAGLGLILVNEKVSMITDGEYFSANISGSAVNMKLLFGVHIKPLYFELQYNYGNYSGGEGAGGNNLNLGGLTLSGGLKF
jgi:opacity protein-like surface antigen